MFSPELLQEVEQQKGLVSRRALARLVCERLEWKNAKGQFQLMSARMALSALHRRGTVVLPASRFVQPARRAVNKLAAPPEPLACSLAGAGPVELVLVKGRRSKAARLWRQAMEHHYLGAGPLCGAQLRYLIQSPKGCLGALAFSAAALQARARDEAIGWPEEVRRHRLEQVVNNSRFLILPWVKIPHLASHVLGLAARRLPEDWQERYGIRPLLLESFVQTARFKGTCYQAAGWQCAGQTTGRGRQDRQHQRRAGLKSIWLKPLDSRWKELLCQPPEKPRLAPRRRPPAAVAPVKAPPRNWAEAELGAAALGDGRLTRRLVALLEDFYACPGAQIPEACGNQAKTKAAYRFFDHSGVNLQKILAPHREQTVARMRQHPVILAVQDTTELDYTSHPLTEGLGPIGNHRPGVQGMLLHPTVAYTPAGAPLGLIDAQTWVRDPDHQIKFRQPIEQKESFKWLKSFAATEQAQALCPGTMLVNVGDSEADMYELFEQAQKSSARLLVRAFRERLLQTSETELWAQLRSQPAAGTVRFQIPRRHPRKARAADLSIRFGAFEIQPPACLKKHPAIKLWAVMLREETPPDTAEGEPVEWLLLTSLPVETLEQAVEKASWYGQRFQIEVFFRTLKTGRRIEERQLANAQRLENCLAIDLVAAWRIMMLKQLARETPEASGAACLEPAQCQALSALAGKSEPLTLRESVRCIAGLGGFLGRKRDGEPGVQTLWRGLRKLNNIVEGFTLARALQARPVSSAIDYG